ncbi:hypothetical protein [Streptacidiphilus sp. EB103A]|uniref:hypothetical protein n=1 Tax=Streptacidiphilus sp. EB103A TaxID=3156275 RepID=UPI003512971E
MGAKVIRLKIIHVSATGGIGLNSARVVGQKHDDNGDPIQFGHRRTKESGGRRALGGEFPPVQLARYAPRLVKALPLVDVQGRTLKAYAMFAQPEGPHTPPEPEWLRQQAASVLTGPPQEGDHPAGLLILHHGADGTYLLVSQWYGGDMLKHWVRGSVVDADGSTTFARLDQRDLVACVWELEIVRFERDAWVNTVLVPGRLDQDSLDAYLATTFSGWV